MMIEINYQCFGKSTLDPTICSGNGICIDKDLCSCIYGSTGNECQYSICYGKNSSDPNVCSGNGICMSTDNCVCGEMYNGHQCEYDFTTIKTTVYTFGRNGNAELGDGTLDNRNLPTKIPKFNIGISKIIGGVFSKFIINNASKTFGFGTNNV
jgi:hypothetical protein